MVWHADFDGLSHTSRVTSLGFWHEYTVMVPERGPIVGRGADGVIKTAGVGVAAAVVTVGAEVTSG